MYPHQRRAYYLLRNSRNADSAIVKPGWYGMDLAKRLSPGFDLKEELLSGRVKILTETDRLAPHDKEKMKHTSCFYNWHPKQMIGNYENWSLRNPSKIGVYFLTRVYTAVLVV